MKTAALVLLACMCASIQAQEVRLEHTDVVGPGFAFLGDEISIDLVLDFPPPPLFTAEEFTITYDTGLVTSIGIDSSLPSCPVPVFEMTGVVTNATGAFAALTPPGTPIAGPIDIDGAAVASGSAGIPDINTINVNVGGFCFSNQVPSNCPLGGTDFPIVSIDNAALTFVPGQNVGGLLDVTAFSPTFALDIVINFDFDAGTFFATDTAGALGTVSGNVKLSPGTQGLMAAAAMTGAVSSATGAFVALTPPGTPVAGPIDIDSAAVASGSAGIPDINTIDVNVGLFCFSNQAIPNCPLGGEDTPIVSIDNAALTFAPGQNVGGVLDFTAFSPAAGLDIVINFDFDAGSFFATDTIGALGTVSGNVKLSLAAAPCMTVTGSSPGSLQLFFEDTAGFDGLLIAATLHFSSDQTGDALFEISGGGVSTLPINYVETAVTIADTQFGQSGSLPEEFENTTGVPQNWSTFFLPGGNGPVWGSNVECELDNFTGGAGNAACLQNSQPTEGGNGLAGSFLCTDSPLDTSTAVLPVLGLLANFQPNPGGATFRVNGGDTAPPNVAGYVTLFETDDPIGAFGALPGESLTVPLPFEPSLYICVVVEGDYAYAEVDECVSCAVSYGVQDSDGDGFSDNADNCVNVFNPDQRDTDNDDIGNACDADIAPAANDCVVNSLDMQAMKVAFFAQTGEPNYNPDADFNGDGVVNFVDLGVTKLQYFGPPGPSGLPNACDDTQRGVRLRDCGIPD